MFARRAHCLAAALGLYMIGILLASAAFAQQMGLPGARLYSVHPAGGKAGTTVEVLIDGADLDGAAKLHFSAPQITAVQKMGEPELGQTGPQPQDGKFTVTIPADVAPGIYEVRAIGKYGISNPRAFVVGADQEILETESNNNIKTATEIAQGAIINGGPTPTPISIISNSPLRPGSGSSSTAGRTVSTRGWTPRWFCTTPRDENWHETATPTAGIRCSTIRSPPMATTMCRSTIFCTAAAPITPTGYV